MAYLLLPPIIVMTIWLWLFKAEFRKKKQILLIHRGEHWAELSQDLPVLKEGESQCQRTEFRIPR